MSCYWLPSSTHCNMFNSRYNIQIFESLRGVTNMRVFYRRVASFWRICARWIVHNIKSCCNSRNVLELFHVLKELVCCFCCFDILWKRSGVSFSKSCFENASTSIIIDAYKSNLSILISTFDLFFDSLITTVGGVKF